MQLRDGEIFNDCFLAFTPFGGAEVDITQYVQEVTTRMMRDEKDNTRMGHTSKSRKPGLGEWSFQTTLIQQYGSAQGGVNIDKVIWDQLNSNGTGSIRFKPFNAAVAVHNPQYSGPVTIFAHDIAKGKVGDLLTTTPEFKSSGNLVRVEA